MITPGNWSVGKDCGSVVSDQIPPDADASAGHCHIDDYGGYLIAESIARLADRHAIAAIPDLIRELTDFHNHAIDQDWHECDGIPGGCPVLKALAKARGERSKIVVNLHTLGPWRVDHPYSIEIQSAEGKHVATARPVPSFLAAEKEMAANAMLIASSPDLLAACQLWDTGFEEGQSFDLGELLEWMNRNRRAARAAIAKALNGES